MGESEIPALRGFDSYEVRLGDELRGHRATIGKSLLDVQRDLRIKASYIDAIENCDASVIPNRGFVPGYVRAYARVALERSALISVWTSEAKHLSSARRSPMSRRLRAWSTEWTDELRTVRPELTAEQARILVAGAIGLISTTATAEMNTDGLLEDRITSMAMATLAAPIN